MAFNMLVVEDAAQIREVINDYFVLKGEGVFEVQFAVDGDKGLEMISEREYDLVLLDIMLPGASGFEICRKLRSESCCPIVFMTALGSEDDILHGYELGADDYIEKPVSVPILSAKVKALLHRSETVSKDRELLSYGNITIDTDKRLVSKNGKICEIRGKMYDLLLYMMENKGRLLYKDELYDAVWGDAFVEQATLNVHIRWLREKLEDEPESPKIIKTVWRKGFIFGEDD